MKKISIFAALAVSIASFAFWEFEGPFKITINTNNSIIYPTNEEITFLFNYNHCTGYTIIHKVHTSSINYIHRKEFLKGKNTEINFSPFDAKNDFFLIKNPLGTTDRNSYIESMATMAIKWYDTRCASYNKSHHFKNLTFNFQTPQPTKNFTTSSDISIINTGKKVRIIQDDKNLNFQETLIKYFDTIHGKDINDFIDISTNEPSSSSKPNLALLKNSTVLEIYAVFRGNTDQNSVIWGLAKNNITNQNYHWITELNNDISVLVNQQ